MLRTVVARVTITSLNSCRFLRRRRVPGTMSRRFFTGDRASGGPSWSEDAVEYFERRGEFNG